jgi:hypothetical protein
LAGRQKRTLGRHRLRPAPAAPFSGFS